MFIQDAIEKAREHGYEVVNKIAAYNKETESIEIVPDYPCAYIDPKFWFAFGQYKGWTHRIWVTPVHEIEEWKYMWHKFIDHLLEDKTPDSWFIDLDLPEEQV